MWWLLPFFILIVNVASGVILVNFIKQSNPYVWEYYGKPNYSVIFSVYSCAVFVVSLYKREYLNVSKLYELKKMNILVNIFIYSYIALLLIVFYFIIEGLLTNYVL